MIEFGPAQLYGSPKPPDCPTHGQMQLDKSSPLIYDPAPQGLGNPAVRYVCHGFDGEGCEQACAEPMTHLGTADRIEFTL